MFITARGFANDLEGTIHQAQSRDERAMTCLVIGKGALSESGMSTEIQRTLGDIQTEISDRGIHKLRALGLVQLYLVMRADET
jgi:hypothetical protein